MNVQTDERPGPAKADPAAEAARTQAVAVVTAGAGLFTSLRRVFSALVALFTAESQVFVASLAVVVIGAVALIACAVALWVCIVALIGWALAVATHSVGIALAILVGLHVILVVGIWFAIRRTVLQAMFPRTRAELSAVRGTLKRNLAKFQHGTPRPTKEDSVT